MAQGKMNTLTRNKGYSIYILSASKLDETKEELK
jgi:hypothetical protein